MRCKCKVLSVSGTPAADGSIVPFDVMNSYINSEECKSALREHRMIGSLTHRSRSITSVTPQGGALSKVIGKDDSMLCVAQDFPTPTHYISKLFIEDGWLWCEIEVLSEDGLDDAAIQNIRRLKGMLRNGIHPGISAVIVGYWKSTPGSGDVLSSLKELKGIDVTLNPSWKLAGVKEIYDDNNKPVEDSEKTFSETEYTAKDFEFTGLKVKAFSDLGAFGCGNMLKTSKIDGQFTKLKVKEFSANGMVYEIPEETHEEVSEQKEFSVQTIKERIRESKLSPRLRFRKLYIYYKQVVRQMGGVEKIDSETLEIMKSLFTSDVLDIMKNITPQVVEGRPINSLIGASSLGKGPRQAAQKLQIPFKMAMQEAKKNGFLSKMRYQKLQEAYLEFINSLMDDVFGNIEDTSIPEDVESEEDLNKD